MLHCDFRAGDLLFFYGTSWQSRVIEAVTRGPSHVGIIIEHNEQPLLIESTTLCDLPCEILERPVQGVQTHDPLERIAEYAGTVSRVPILAALCPHSSERLTAIALQEFLGRPYDLAGALESGTRLFKFTDFMPCPDLNQIFCSAFCAHLLMRVGRMNWANPKRFNPADLLRTVRRDATHGKPIALKTAHARYV
jgi:hypothetical protein